MKVYISYTMDDCAYKYIRYAGVDGLDAVNKVSEAQKAEEGLTAYIEIWINGKAEPSLTLDAFMRSQAKELLS